MCFSHLDANESFRFRIHERGFQLAMKRKKKMILLFWTKIDSWAHFFYTYNIVILYLMFVHQSVKIFHVYYHSFMIFSRLDLHILVIIFVL